MKRFSFSTFQVDDSNREAFDICRSVSELRSVEPQPVLLLGDDGCGKTHLLYSIVNHVRASSARAGLAYVTAREFPEEVRRLTEDPSPLERAPAAILLVDQLENFAHRADELESVVAVFLGGGHQVVLASSVHPARLRHLPESLRSLLAAGRIVTLKPRVVTRTTADRESEFTPLTEDLFTKQQEENRLLREQLARAKKAETDTAERIRAAQEERDRAETAIQQLETERRARLQQQADLDAVRKKIAQLEEQLGDTTSIDAERENVKRLNREYELVEAERDRAVAERDRLREEYKQFIAQIEDERQAKEDEIAQLRRELNDASVQAAADIAAAHAERDAARETVGRLEERALGLLQRMESYRDAYARTESERQDRITQLEQRIAELRVAGRDEGRAAEAESRMAEVMDQMETLRGESENARREFEMQVATARAEVRQAAAARDRAIEKLDQLTASHAQLEIELESVRVQLDAQTSEMDALRHEAAEQVAAANAQAGEIERKYAELLSSFDLARQTGHVVGMGLESLRQQIVESSDSIAKLASRLANTLGDTEGNGAEQQAASTKSGEAAAPSRRGSLTVDFNGLFDDDSPPVPPTDDAATRMAGTIRALTEDTDRVGRA